MYSSSLNYLHCLSFKPVLLSMALNLARLMDMPHQTVWTAGKLLLQQKKKKKKHCKHCLPSSQYSQTHYLEVKWSMLKFGTCTKMVREKSRERHNYKPQPLPETKRKRKQTKPNTRKSNKQTKALRLAFFPKRLNRNAERADNHKNKITQGKTKNKSLRRINHKATKSKTNTGSTAFER